jgi:hypothetical protein
MAIAAACTQQAGDHPRRLAAAALLDKRTLHPVVELLLPVAVDLCVPSIHLRPAIEMPIQLREDQRLLSGARDWHVGE